MMGDTICEGGIFMGGIGPGMGGLRWPGAAPVQHAVQRYMESCHCSGGGRIGLWVAEEVISPWFT